MITDNLQPAALYRISLPFGVFPHLSAVRFRWIMLNAALDAP